MNLHEFVMMLRRHGSENMLLDLAVEGQPAPVKVMVKALQHHPVTGQIIHVDFYEVSMTRAIEMEVPLKLSGHAVGVANEGGMLEQSLRTLRVECLPADVVNEIELDVSGLHVGDGIHVRDVVVDTAKLRILDDADQLVVAVAAPRLSGDDTSAEGEAAGEPEVATAKKAAEEDGADKK